MVCLTQASGASRPTGRGEGFEDLCECPHGQRLGPEQVTLSLGGMADVNIGCFKPGPLLLMESTLCLETVLRLVDRCR